MPRRIGVKSSKTHTRTMREARALRQRQAAPLAQQSVVTNSTVVVAQA